MHCFRNILMIAPHAQRADTALQVPIALAQAWGADTTVVDVPDSSALRQTSRRRRVDVSGRAPAGELVPEIVRQVERNGHDLVVVSAAAQGPIGGKFVGVPIVPLMRGCPCPVWVLKPTPAPHGGVLVAVNPGSAEDPDGVLGHRLIRLAACFARSARSPLSIIHVWHLPGEPQIRRPLVGATPAQITALLNGAYKSAETRIQRLMDQIGLGDIRYKLYLEEGRRPGKTIAEFAVRGQIETVVMGMTARSGVAGLLAGNSAEEVLRGAACSVVTLASHRSFPSIERDEGLLAGKRRQTPLSVPAEPAGLRIEGLPRR